MEDSHPPSKRVKVDEDPPKTALHPFFTKSAAMADNPRNNSDSSLITWSRNGGLLVGVSGKEQPNGRIAAFDFDDTITTTKGDHTFSKGPDDWKFTSSRVVERIRTQAETHRIVIFTNQNKLLPDIATTSAKKKTISKNSKSSKEDIFKGKMHGVAKTLASFGIPLIVFAAVQNDEFRKPRVGMWESLVAEYNGGVEIKVKDSFYVGDAAGRLAHGSNKKDHSTSDLRFAQNIGVPFYVPEEYFTGDSSSLARIPSPIFDPRSYLDNTEIPLFLPTKTPLVPIDLDGPELIIFVGPPASGKTSFAHRYLVPKDYVWVNQDTLKRRDKCVKTALDCLKEGKRVVVDNTCPDKATRAEFVNVAKQAGGVSVRVFHFTASKELCRHNNVYRSLTSRYKNNGVDEREILPDIAFNTYFSKFQEIDEETEGINEVKKINFVPHFPSGEDRRLWALWWN